MKFLLIAAALVAAPGLATAQCNWSKGERVTTSCAPGTSYDAATQSCVADTTS
ncbi:hypothetical protein JSE7799_02356 [Jannaschia seosinensis]|uniref:Chitin-binding type-2 domain-containing protein n=1 Tax=Jannaschia seosinensis TaxID=313367 RepID=A0A0M7BBQ6_9RHOB|nr:adenylosuccinate lyase [Jannaschia seosinensis]CUH39629.1 hypothetical protein JSE7799_02356 [Jannaschia seosinensis]